MSPTSQPRSLVAERAVRLLRRRGHAIPSLELLAELLSTRAQSEATAARILESAFLGDRRLAYDGRAWGLDEEARGLVGQLPASGAADPDRVLLLVDGGRGPAGGPYRLRTIAALRLRHDEVVAACGGDASSGLRGSRLRRAAREAIEGAVPVIHDPPGALTALERWLGSRLPVPISLRRLGQRRLGLAAQHDLQTLAARLGLHWRGSDDPLVQAETLDACLQSLRQPGEPLHQLRLDRLEGPKPLDWSRFAFEPGFLQRIPRSAGTYRFYDHDGRLIYVGKSNNLHRRIASYFRQSGRPRSARVQALLESLHRIEYDTSGSNLEAMLREAEIIRRERPSNNVQREVHPKSGRSSRLLSLLILEPAEPPAILRAYLVRRGKLVARVSIGPRGGGLKRIERALEEGYFSTALGARETEGPDLDAEVVLRWLATNRDRAAAFDPSELPSAREVIARLRGLLAQGSPFDPDGTPILAR